LTAAFYLALLGHEVTVFEAAARPGGMLRYALPQYRLPKTTLDREIDVIRGLGVRFTCNAALHKEITLEELTGANDAVLLAFGTWEEQDLGVPGRERAGVLPALDFLGAVARGKEKPVGRKVIVIGGGNAAIDSARTALRLGAEVTIVYRRTREEMPAIAEETAHALEEGARLVTLAAPVQVLGENGEVTGLEVEKTTLGKFDARGRRTPVPTGEKYVIPCDTIIEAIGQKVEGEVSRRLNLRLAGSGTVEVDPWTLRTNDPRVSAAGDVVTGAANVSGAMALGKKAAQNIDRQLTGQDRFRELWPALEYDHTPPPHDQGGPRVAAKIAGPAARRHNFNEVTQTFTAARARAETLRCLRCDIKATGEDEA
jgi:NADPH-dependent glutamate synthase beta subunit-like oxidoreductase